MNRRDAITGTAASVTAVLVSSRSALARLQHLGTPVPEDESKPPFSYGNFTPSETLYLGTLFTWLEMLEGTIDALGPAIEELESDMTSEPAKTAMLMPLGVWIHLDIDVQKTSAPDSFTEADAHAREAFAHLATAANIISRGIVSGSPTAISIGSGDIYLANDHVGALVDALPFARPRRHEIIG